ncbi:MFS transporter [Roseomonas sp. NAR14]|uniref:MFS transporter n=1 Tax=Roseomonas acroporae TaxID=2937791 RepID=A0A9X2BXS6_9PROT|nr:MFS transporter [Roseomonas acroporae]MCK8787601.1 MFS transporter [Roseomonas acroporae]
MHSAKRQILFVNLAHTITHYALLILATAVLGMIAQEPGRFGDGYGAILALGTGLFVVYGAGSLPMGWLAARFGSKAMMVAFFLGSGLCLIAAGFATGPFSLALTLALAGAFLAIYHPVGTAMLVEAAGDKIGRSVGVNGAFGNFGVALAPVVTALLAQVAGWRWGFLVPGVVCVVAGLLYLREPAFDAHKARAAARPFPAIPPAVVRRAVITLMSIAVVSGLVFNAFTLLLPRLMQERLASSPDLLPLVGGLAFAVTLTGGLTQFTVGRMIDRMTLKRVFLPLGLIPLPAFLLLWRAEGWAVLVLSALIAAAIFGQVTVNETMTARYIAPALRVKLYSIRFFVGFLGAAAASPLIAWLYGLGGGVGLVLLVLAGFGTVTLLCALFFPDRPEELRPELWAAEAPPAPPAAVAAE